MSLLHNRPLSDTAKVKIFERSRCNTMENIHHVRTNFIGFSTFCLFHRHCFESFFFTLLDEFRSQSIHYGFREIPKLDEPIHIQCVFD